MSNEILKDERIATHQRYDEFEQIVYREQLAIGDSVSLTINGKPIKEYIVRYTNAHVHITIQDKGVKKSFDIGAK